MVLFIILSFKYMYVNACMYMVATGFAASTGWGHKDDKQTSISSSTSTSSSSSSSTSVSSTSDKDRIRRELKAFFRPANAMLYYLLGLGSSSSTMSSSASSSSGDSSSGSTSGGTSGGGFVTIGFDAQASEYIWD